MARGEIVTAKGMNSEGRDKRKVVNLDPDVECVIVSESDVKNTEKEGVLWEDRGKERIMPEQSGGTKSMKPNDANRKLNLAIRDKACKRFCGSRKRAMDFLADQKEEYVVLSKEEYEEMEKKIQRLHQQLKDRDQQLADIEAVVDANFRIQ